MSTKIWKTTANGNLATTGNWTGGTPVSGDDVYFPAGTPAITTGYTSLNNATLSGSLGKVIFQEGYANTQGDASNNVQFTCTRFDYNASGIGYFDLEASTCSPTIYGT